MITTETIGTVMLAARLDVQTVTLNRWVHQSVLQPVVRAQRTGGLEWRWDPLEQVAAMAVAKAWKTGIVDTETLQQVAHAVYLGPGRHETPALTVIVDPDTPADLGLPFDRHTLIVETRTPPDEKRP